MPAPYSAGTIFVSVVPSFKGVQNDIRKEYTRAARDAGNDFGDEFSATADKKIVEGVKQTTKKTRSVAKTAGKEAGDEYAGNFVESLRTAITRAQKDLKVVAKVDVDNAGLKALQTRLAAVDGKIKGEFDSGEILAEIEAVESQLRRMWDEAGDGRLRMDIAPAIAALETFRAKAERDIKLDIEADIKVPRQMGAFEKELRARLKAATDSLPAITPEMDTDELDHEIARIRGELLRLQDPDINFDVHSDQALLEILALEAALDRVMAKAGQRQALHYDSQQARDQLKAVRDNARQSRGQELDLAPQPEPEMRRLDPALDRGDYGDRYQAASSNAGAQLEAVTQRLELDDRDAAQEINQIRLELSLLDTDFTLGMDSDEVERTLASLESRLRRFKDSATDAEVRNNTERAIGSIAGFRETNQKNSAAGIEPDQKPDRQVGAFEQVLRNRVEAALASIPPVEIDGDPTPIQEDILRIRRELHALGDIKLDADGGGGASAIMAARAQYEALKQQIESDTIDPNLRFNLTGAAAQLKAFLDSVDPKITPDLGYFRERMIAAVESAQAAIPEIKLDADSSDVDKTLMEIRARMEALKENIKVGLDADEVRAEYLAIQRMLGSLRDKKVNVEVRADVMRAITQLEMLDKEVNKANRSSFDAANSFRAFSGPVLGIAALGPLVIPVIAGIGGALAALGPFLAVGAAGAGVFALGIMGISTAVTAMSDVQKNAVKDAKTYADGVRNAGRSLQSAREAVSKAARATGDAERQGAERVASAIEAVADREKDLSRAQVDATRKQEALTQARKDASKRLIDLQMQIRGGALAERRAYMQLAEAEVAYANALVDPGATRTEREQLLLSLDEQKFQLDSVTESNKRLAEEQGKANQQGIEGSDQVVAAKQGVADANERISDAETALAKAQAAVSTARIEAQRAVADAQQATADAQQRLIDAQQDYRDAVDKTSASQDALNQAMANLGPAGQAFATYLFGLKPLLKELRDSAQAGLLPGMQEWMQSIITTHGPALKGIVEGLSGAMGDMFRTWGTELQDPGWTRFFDMIESKGPGWMDQFGQISSNFGTGLVNLITAFTPLTDDLGTGLVGMSEDFKTWTEGLANSEGFQTLLAYIQENGPMLMAFFDALVGAVWNIGVALAPYAEILMGFFTGLLDWIAGLDPDTLQTFIVVLLAIVLAFQTIMGLSALFAGIAQLITIAMVPVLGPILLIVGAVVLVGLALAVLWARSETFRDIVTGVWDAILAAVTFVVDLFQTYVLPVIQTVLKALGDFFTWLWHDIIEPILGVWQVAWGVLWDFLKAMWDKVGKPMFDMIMGIFKDVWEIISPILTLLGMAFEALWWVLEKAWKYVGKPIFDAFISVITFLWEYVIGPVLQAIAVAFGWLFGIIESAWNATGKPVLDLFQAIVEGLVQVFQGSFDGIKGIWDALLDILMAPIVLVVETVLNKGLIAGINHIAGIFTDDDTWIDPIPTDWIPGRATGGPIPGSSPNKRADNVLIRATAGEYMQQVDAVDYYGVDMMDAMNQRLIPRELLYSALQGRAYGGLIDPMWEAVRKQFPDARLTSNYRAGDPGYHGKKKAIDVGGAHRYPDSRGIAEMLQINRWMAEVFPYAAEIIHSGAGSINIKDGKPHQYNAKTVADHFDHVHLAMNAFNGLSGDGDGGGFWDMVTGFLGGPIDFLKGLVTKSAGALNDNDMGKMLLNIPMDFASKAVDPLLDIVNGIKDAAGNVIGTVGGWVGLGDDGAMKGKTTRNGVQGIVQGVASKYGWDSGYEWSALSTLINKESGWNPTAQNPSSTAYGLGQFLNSTWATVGGKKTSDPELQAEYMMKYIGQRYGNPSGALSFHNKNNWYGHGGEIQPLLFDQGGRLDPGLNLVMNATRQPEAILNPTQLDNIQRIADSGGRAPLLGSLTLPMVAANPHEAVDEIMHALSVVDLGGRYGESDD